MKRVIMSMLLSMALLVGVCEKGLSQQKVTHENKGKATTTYSKQHEEDGAETHELRELRSIKKECKRQTRLLNNLYIITVISIAVALVGAVVASASV